MNVTAELENLQRILRKAIDEPAAVAAVIGEFLTAYDALPDDVDAERGGKWRRIHDLAYELRYYSPTDADDDDTLLDDRAALHAICQSLARAD